MEINYPIFLMDRDKWMFIIHNTTELNSHLEHIDIEDKEYSGWDINAFPLELYLEQKEIKVRHISSEPQLNRLKEAIFNYAKLARPKVPFVYSGPEDNVIELFKAVEEHIMAGSFTQKLKRFLFKTK